MRKVCGPLFAVAFGLRCLWQRPTTNPKAAQNCITTPEAALTDTVVHQPRPALLFGLGPAGRYTGLLNHRHLRVPLLAEPNAAFPAPPHSPVWRFWRGFPPGHPKSRSAILGTLSPNFGAHAGKQNRRSTEAKYFVLSLWYKEPTSQKSDK